MSGNALPFGGNLYVYLIVFANTFQIQTKYKIRLFVISDTDISNFCIQIHI